MVCRTVSFAVILSGLSKPSYFPSFLSLLLFLQQVNIKKKQSNGWLTQVRLKRVKTLCRYLLLEKLGFVEHCLLYIFLFGCVCCEEKSPCAPVWVTVLSFHCCNVPLFSAVFSAFVTYIGQTDSGESVEVHTFFLKIWKISATFIVGYSSWINRFWWTMRLFL